MAEPGTILLVEDDANLNAINRRALEAEGYTVLTALSLAQARAHLAGSEPDIILLDVLLPDGNGIDFCGEIRDGTHAHILFLTSRVEHADRLKGLGVGGDNYFVKPYRLDEMLSHLRATMRRRRMDAGKALSQAVVHGPLTLDIIAQRALLFGEDLLLRQKEFSLLLLLLENKGRPLPAEVLYKAVWKLPMCDDGGAIWTQLSRLKKKLEEKSGGAITIWTSRGKGYEIHIADPG